MIIGNIHAGITNFQIISLNQEGIEQIETGKHLRHTFQMNRLPLDVQLIVFKYIHAQRLHIVFKDMMIQLRKEQPYLHPVYLVVDYYNLDKVNCYVVKTYGGRNSYDITLWHGTIIVYSYDTSFDNYWKYPYWYYELSVNFIESRRNRAN